MSSRITKLRMWGPSRAPRNGEPCPLVSRVIGRMMGKESREESQLALHPAHWCTGECISSQRSCQARQGHGVPKGQWYVQRGCYDTCQRRGHEDSKALSNILSLFPKECWDSWRVGRESWENWENILSAFSPAEGFFLKTWDFYTFYTYIWNTYFHCICIFFSIFITESKKTRVSISSFPIHIFIYVQSLSYKIIQKKPAS